MTALYGIPTDVDDLTEEQTDELTDAADDRGNRHIVLTDGQQGYDFHDFGTVEDPTDGIDIHRYEHTHPRYKASDDLSHPHPGYGGGDNPVVEYGNVSVAAEGGVPLTLGGDSGGDNPEHGNGNGDDDWDVELDHGDNQTYTEGMNDFEGYEVTPARTTTEFTQGEGREYFGAAGSTIFDLQHDREVSFESPCSTHSDFSEGCGDCFLLLVTCPDHDSYESDCSDCSVEEIPCNDHNDFSDDCGECEDYGSVTGNGVRPRDNEIRRKRLGVAFSALNVPDALKEDVKSIIFSTNKAQWGRFNGHGGGFRGATVAYIAFLHCDNREQAEDWAKVDDEPPIGLTEKQLHYAVKYAFEHTEELADVNRVESVAETWRLDTDVSDPQTGVA